MERCVRVCLVDPMGQLPQEIERWSDRQGFESPDDRRSVESSPYPMPAGGDVEEHEVMRSFDLAHVDLTVRVRRECLLAIYGRANFECVEHDWPTRQVQPGTSGIECRAEKRRVVRGIGEENQDDRDIEPLQYLHCDTLVLIAGAGLCKKRGVKGDRKDGSISLDDDATEIQSRRFDAAL